MVLLNITENLFDHKKMIIIYFYFSIMNNIIDNFKLTVIKSNRVFTLNELLIILTEIYNEFDNSNLILLDEEDDDIPKKIGRPKKIKENKEKRKPTAYNLFITAKYPDVKKENPDKKTTDILKMIAVMWKESKKTG